MFSLQKDCIFNECINILIWTIFLDIFVNLFSLIEKTLLLKIVGCIDYGRFLYLNLYVLSSEDILLANPN